MPIRFNTVEDLIYAILNEVGFSITNDGYLYDQDNFNSIVCGSNKIKCSIDPNKPVFSSEFSIVFDPINNVKLMTFVMTYYFKKEEAAGNFTVLSYDFQDQCKHGPDNIRIKFVGGATIESNYYYNRALKISDIILRLGGYNPDLSNFDKVDER